MNISNVYNLYNSGYIPRTNTKYDSHKSTELKTVYSKMVKLNKESPLYKFTMSDSNQQFAIGLKDSAISLEQASEFLSDSQDSVFDKKNVASSDEQSVYATLTSEDYDKIPSSLSINVNQLATGQINESAHLPNDYTDIIPGQYSINFKTNNQNSTIKMSVGRGNSNYKVLKDLATAINQLGTSVEATLVSSETSSYLRLNDRELGDSSSPDGLSFSFNGQEGSKDIIEMLGLNNVTQIGSNSSLTINGEAYSSSSNNISINNTISLDLYKETSEPVNINVVPDTNQVISKLDDFIHAYNNLIDMSKESNRNPMGTRRLAGDIGAITKHHSNALESNGLTIDDNGKLVKEDSLLLQGIKDGEVKSLFNDLSDFKNDIKKATEKLTLNPLAYIDKVVVTYPNTANSYPNPYMPSVYSGLLYNQYV